MMIRFHSASLPRARLDPREVDELIDYAMSELGRHNMSFINDDGVLVCIGTSRGKMARLARDALRVLGPEKARQTVDEHIANLIEVERDSYRLGFTDIKRKAADLLEQGDGSSQMKEIQDDL
ncbi:conserved protein of unknown function [Microbacterium sp. Nx66]|uniref:hypothetical protein n=1 Tax=Microbacterium sp. Nx66 TaxID=2766784 RepID=UPI0016576000|nr:hypothetical protein [Microbacterium sp. Nx66]CAD5141143.1 conserved protein of unknown function [Microbacterium sp. Nx66]